MIIASFPSDGDTYVTVTDDVWQYDYGQVLQIEGLTVDDVTELDFATSTTATYASALAGVKIADTVMQVTIPDSILRNDYRKQDFNIYVWVFVITGDSGETTHRITIPVKTRPRRDEYDEDPSSETNPFDEAIAAVNSAAQRAGNSASEAAASAEAAAEAGDYAQEIYNLLQVALGNFKSVSITKENGVTTLTVTGDDGEVQTATINDGADGRDGESAYEIAVDYGYEGDEQDWLASLHGKDGTINWDYEEDTRTLVLDFITNDPSSGTSDYVLPVATANKLGGIKIGDGIKITTDGVATVDFDAIADNPDTAAAIVEAGTEDMTEEEVKAAYEEAAKQ